MKSLPWVVAGVGVGFATYFLLNRPAAQSATGSDTIEAAANRTADWGSGRRITGTGRNLFGKAKEAFGLAIGNQRLTDEGTADRFVGAVNDTAGETAQALGKTIHDLNR